MGSPRAGSNPAECGNFCNFLLFATFYFLFTQLSLISSRQPWSPHLDQLSWFLGAKSGRISSVTSSMIDFSEFSTSLCNRRWRQDSGVLRFFGPERRGLQRRGFCVLSEALSAFVSLSEALSAFVRERERWSASGYAEGSPGTGAHPRDVITLLPCVCLCDAALQRKHTCCSTRLVTNHAFLRVVLKETSGST